MLKSIVQLRRHFGDLIDYWRAFRREEQTDLRVVKVDSESYRVAARQLHAAVYLSRNFVEDREVVGGFLSLKIDPYHFHSQYFIVLDKKTGNLVATARQIEARRSRRHNSFAMFTRTPLYKRAVKLITRYDPLDCVEISGLAKHRGVSKIAPLLLYRAMWQHSIERQHKLWLLVCDYHLFARLKLLFGPAIQKVGPITFYLGSNSVPAILKLTSSIQAIERAIDNAAWYQRWLRRRVAQFMLKGINADLISEKEYKALISINKKYHLLTDGERTKKLALRIKLRLVAIGLLLIYTLIRFVAVRSFLEGYGVNAWVFLVIDSVTAIFYVIGVEKLILFVMRKSESRRSLPRLIFWAAVTAGAFSAPYAYIYLASKELPVSLGIGLGIVVLLLLVNAVGILLRRIKRSKQ